MTKVELHQAFMWVCDSCGVDNFERAVRLSRSQVRRVAAQRSDVESDGAYLRAPRRVTCRMCKAEYRTTEP